MLRFKALFSLACLAALLLLLEHDATALTPPLPLYARKLTFSPDGKLVAALGIPVKTGPRNDFFNNHGARVWTVADGKGYRTYPWAQSEAGNMAFSSDSQYLALSGEGGIKLVHLPTNVVQETLATQIAAEKFSFSPDGKWLVVQGPWSSNAKEDEPQQRGHRDFEIWQLATRTQNSQRSQQRIEFRDFEIRYFPSSAPVVTSALPPNFDWCLPASEKYLWSQIRSSDGQWQAFGKENTVRVWDATSCTPKYTFSLPEQIASTLLLFSPKNRWLLGERSPQIFLWNLAQGTTINLNTDSGRGSLMTSAYAISDDENLIALTQGVSHYSNYTPILTVYDMNTGQRLSGVFK